MSDKLREAAKAALMTLAHLDHLNYAQEEIFNLQEALAEPDVQESLTAQRPWVGLTDEEVTEIRLKMFDVVATNYEAYRAIEAKLREKNT
jgi:hypothetical protein